MSLPKAPRPQALSATNVSALGGYGRVSARRGSLSRRALTGYPPMEVSYLSATLVMAWRTKVTSVCFVASLERASV